MALDNLAPKVLLKVSKKRHVPYIGVISLSVVTTLLCNFDFSVLVTMDVTMLMVDYVLVFISAARLRKIEPDTPRPFKIPFGDNFVKILITPGLIIACAALFLNGADYYLGGMIACISSDLICDMETHVRRVVCERSWKIPDRQKDKARVRRLQQNGYSLCDTCSNRPYRRTVLV